MLLKSLSLFLLAGAALVPMQAEPPALIAIQDARVVPVSGAVLEKGTVVFKDGIITDVGATVAVPNGAWVMDGKGLTVYPGLIDGFSTWGIPDGAPAAATPAGRAAQAQAPAGTPPSPRSRGPADRPGTNSWVTAADLVKTTDPRLEAARGAGFTSAATFPRPGLIGGHGAVVNLGGESSGRMVVEPGIGLLLGLGGGGYTGYPSSLMGIFAYYRQLWIDAERYKLNKELYTRSPATIARPGYDRALEGVLAATKILLPATGPMQLERALKLAAELKATPVIYGVVEGYRMAAELKRTSTPVILNVKWPAKDREADPERIDSIKTLELRDKAPESPAALVAAGVKFAVSSDGIDNPKDVIKALKKSIDLGLKMEDALRALTLSAAEIHGVGSRMGSIDRGKIANLVVTNGDLFDDKTKVRMVFIDGVKYLPPPETPPGPRGGAPAAAPGNETQEEVEH
jgi:hypothetical protein